MILYYFQHDIMLEQVNKYYKLTSLLSATVYQTTTFTNAPKYKTQHHNRWVYYLARTTNQESWVASNLVGVSMPII